MYGPVCSKFGVIHPTTLLDNLLWAIVTHSNDLLMSPITIWHNFISTATCPGLLEQITHTQTKESHVLSISRMDGAEKYNSFSFAYYFE